MKVVVINPYKKSVFNHHLFVGAMTSDALLASPLYRVCPLRDNEYLVVDARISTGRTFTIAGVPAPIQGPAIIIGAVDGRLTDTMFHADYIRPSVEFAP